jgi:uncharacterized protein
MRLTETFQLNAPPDRAFAFLSDVPRVASCVSGVEDVEQREDGSYEASLRIQLGPIKAAFAGEVTLDQQPPDRLVADGQGRDRSSGSRAKVAFEAKLSPLEDGSRTEVETVADVTIRGRLGQFGTGVIRATAVEVIREFVACADRELTHEAAPAAAATGTGAPEAPGPGADAGASGSRGGGASQLKLAGRILLNIVRGWWRTLRDWFRSKKGR